MLSVKTQNFKNNSHPLWEFPFFYFDISLQAEEKSQAPSPEMCPAPIFLSHARAHMYKHKKNTKEQQLANQLISLQHQPPQAPLLSGDTESVAWRGA